VHCVGKNEHKREILYRKVEVHLVYSVHDELHWMRLFEFHTSQYTHTPVRVRSERLVCEVWLHPGNGWLRRRITETLLYMYVKVYQVHTPHEQQCTTVYQQYHIWCIHTLSPEDHKFKKPTLESKYKCIDLMYASIGKVCHIYMLSSAMVCDWFFLSQEDLGYRQYCRRRTTIKCR
jgi:hypothetical protein